MLAYHSKYSINCEFWLQLCQNRQQFNIIQMCKYQWSSYSFHWCLMLFGSASRKDKRLFWEDSMLKCAPSHPVASTTVKNTALFCVFKILDEVEKRRAISPALVQPFMRGIMEAPFPAPGRTITVKNFLPGSGTEVTCWWKRLPVKQTRTSVSRLCTRSIVYGLTLQVIELCRPSDSRLEHVDFECLFSSLSLRLLLRVFASLLLERRVIFTADKLRWGAAFYWCRYLLFIALHATNMARVGFFQALLFFHWVMTVVER